MKNESKIITVLIVIVLLILIAVYSLPSSQRHLEYYYWEWFSNDSVLILRK